MFVANAVMSVVNDQLVRPLVLWNFGPDALMPVWNLEVKQGEDLQARLTIDSGLQRMGKKYTVGYVAERYDVPLASGENGESPVDILEPNINAPSVALRDTVASTFSEAEQEAQAELDEFDKLCEQMKADALKLAKQRTAEVVAAAVPVQGA